METMDRAEGGLQAPYRPASLLLWLLLPLVLGLTLAALIPRPVVGLIYFNDAIYSYSARDLIAQIDYARQEPSVRAVVLVLDSPGGTAVDTEAVYLEMAKLRAAKPVVTMVQGMAASGAYYLSVGTDYILCGPSSPVGNVGVISELPPAPTVFEDIASTGPYKLWGSARDAQLREMEAVKQGFLQAVLLGRGDRLKIPAETVLRGQVWMGSEAIRLGLADELGSIDLAIQRAAEMARIANYETADIRELAELPAVYYYLFFYETPEGVLTPYPREPGIYMLYIPPWEGS